MPKEVRQEAYRLLRHYPTVSDIEAIAEHEERLRALTQSAFVRPYLSSEIEADWFSGYPLGPHRI
ncbi:BPSL0761 family protein [Stenotrophomonas maltophilia]|uniref:BPSL0761 family protein n=1 Tax=Stenotrophomonas maltophilia TaxID=40324 RepID=UPI000B26C144